MMLTIELVSNRPRDRMFTSYNSHCEMYASLFRAVPTFINFNCLTYSASSFWFSTNKNITQHILAVFAKFARVLTLSDLFRMGVFLGHNKTIWYELLHKWQISHGNIKQEAIYSYIRHNISRQLIIDTLECELFTLTSIYALILLYERCLFEARSLFAIRHMTLNELEMFMDILVRYISIRTYCLAGEDQQQIAQTLVENAIAWPHFKELKLLIYQFGTAKNIFDVMRYDRDPLGIICIYYYPDRQQRNTYWRAYKRWYC